MFLQVSVCPQAGGGVHPPGQTPLGRHPPWVDQPWADTTS